YMALSGVRDLSNIATPPAKRLAIKTLVQEYNSEIVREGILREIARGGQIYYLYNEVTTIENKVAQLKKLLPEIKINFAHGQMRERELERIMSDFYHHRFNVLVATTIIESGIDIPTANTIIIENADKFGLAQLHQLRGRVGRSHHQAYAYLLVSSFENITKDAEKRLEAISSLEELGAGFTLATHDLEIRGAGEILGAEQSGHMEAIGFTLYMELLTRAVKSLESGETLQIDEESNDTTEVELRIPALIPEQYMHDVHMRLLFYKRISNAKTTTELDEIQIEMIDRFGLLPEVAKNLFQIAELKLHAFSLGIRKLEANKQAGTITFFEKPNIDPDHLIRLIQIKPKEFKFEGSNTIRFHLNTDENISFIEKVENVLKALKK
ncbi:MAG: TRCF domain-containing protein, partial [Gammaproteobacteria bacterium]